MSYLLLFFLFSSRIEAQTPIKVLPEVSSPHEFIHQNPGCLENSECDQVMGHQLNTWSKVLKEASSPKDKSARLARELKERGIPVEFYTVAKVKNFFKPMLFNSSCRHHNPKEGEKIFRGTAFLKSLSLNKAIIWRDQTQIEYRPDQQLVAQPIKVYFSETPTTYLSALDDQPLFMRNNKLYFLKEYDEEFFLLEVSANGDWEIVEMDLTKLTYYEDKKTNIDCPNNKIENSQAFEVKYCKGIWDETTSKLIPVEMYQGCAN